MIIVQDFFYFRYMTALFKKLNYKNQSVVYVLQAPEELEMELEAMSKFCEVRKKLGNSPVAFVLVFVTKQADIAMFATTIANALLPDAVMYFCYPKGTSKKYTCDFNRDTGWQVLGDLGFEPVRIVAVDENWSALRFRKVEHIKTMTRSFAMTAEGKKKAGK